MALTISTHPDKVITNNPQFSVTTSLVEGASYQNLRIRATVYMGGESSPIAVLEQPKGVNNWDFFSLLKNFCGKADIAVGGSVSLIQPTISAELLTAWSEYNSDFETFTTSGREITSAIESDGDEDYAQSNDLGSVAIGDVLVVGLEGDYTDAGANVVKLMYGAVSPSSSYIQQYSGLSAGKLQANHIYFFLITTASTYPYIFLGNASGNITFDGTLTVHKITDHANNPGVYFKVLFQEVYENASDVTTIGGTALTDAMLFIPVVVRPGEAFSDYLLNTAGSKKFLTRGEDGDLWYKYGIGMELRNMFACTYPYVRTQIITDAGVSTGSATPNVGWGMVVLNDNIASIDAEDETAQILIIGCGSGGSPTYNANSMTVSCDIKCYKDVRCLSFVGDLGEEVLLFRGLHTEKGMVDKQFYLDVNRVRKVLKAYRKVNKTLRTLYETEGVRRLLHELIYSEFPVWEFDTNFTDNYRVVTVITDDVNIEDRNELITNDIEIEFYE